LAQVFSGNLLASAIGFLGSIIQAAMVTPSELGMLRMVGIPLGYMIWAHLGVYDGVIREIPYWIGKGEIARAHRYAGVAQGWNLFLSFLSASVFSFLAALSLLQGDYLLAAAWSTQIVCAVSAFYCDFYLSATYRMGVDFARLAWFRMVQAIVALLLVLLIPLLHFYGLCLRAVLVAALGIGLLHCYRPLRVQSTWNWKDFSHLVRIGLPSSCVGYVFSALWLAVEATLVFRYFGTHGLGLYSIAQTAITAMVVLPEAVCFFYWPRMSERYGKTDRLSDALRMTYTPVLVMLAGSVPVVVAAWLLCGPMVTFLMPKYTDVISLLQWGTLVAASRVLVPPLFAFFVIRKQYLYGIAGAFGFGLYYLMLDRVLRKGATIEVFPQCMAVGRVVMAVVGYAFLWCLVRREKLCVRLIS
jgi:O-antigen/teichoic acid export membrane protein